MPATVRREGVTRSYYGRSRERRKKKFSGGAIILGQFMKGRSPAIRKHRDTQRKR